MDEALYKERSSSRGLGEGPYIWLHYKTQFAAQGRLNVLQAEVPLPAGASPELRERLLQEAVEGLEQLAARMEQRVSQLQRKPAALERGLQPASPPPGQSQAAAGSSPRPAAAAKAGEIQAPGGTGPRRRMAPSLPSTPGVFGNANSDLTLPQFLQILRDNFRIDSKQAMRMLGVRTLSNLNLREALDQVRYLLSQETRQSTAAAPTSFQTQREERGSRDPSAGSPYVASRREWSQARSREEIFIEDEELADRPAGVGEALEDEQLSATALPEDARSWDEPPDDLENDDIDAKDDLEDDAELIETDEAEQLDEETAEADEAEPLAISAEGSARRALSIQERIHARTLLNKLRDVRGSTPASPARLTVLRNVVASQISEEQLQELIRFVWGLSAPKQLTIDQVEALISWAKQDDFESEVEALLSLT
jgi:hypothetical protein